MLRSVAFLLAGCVLLRAEAAYAGCPSVCDIVAEPAVVDPELACLSLEVDESTCDCGLQVGFDNQCSATLQFSDTVFPSCGSPALGSRTDCTTLAPGESTGLTRLRARGDGELRSVMTFSADGIEHTATFVAHVSNFDDSGCTCRYAGAVSPHTSSAAVAFAVAALGLFVRRQRRA